VALKIISKSHIKKQVHVTRLKREVRIMKLLDHPNIVKLYDVAETEKDVILVMEYVEGGKRKATFNTFNILSHQHIRMKQN